MDDQDEHRIDCGIEVQVGVQHSRADAAAAQPPAHHDNVEATVFVRGLPLDTLQYELQDRMSRFGKLKACRCDLCHRDSPLVQR